MDITPKKYLLLDSRVIKHSENCKLTLGKVTKSKNNPLFTEDKLWEPRFDNLYANIIFDTANNQAYYRCWYSPFIIDYATSKTENTKKLINVCNSSRFSSSKVNLHLWERC